MATLVQSHEPRTLDVIIVTYRNQHSISHLLHDIARSHGDIQVHILVVDNSPDNATVDEIRRDHPLVEILKSGANIGYAAAINLGLQRSSPSSHKLILNPDLRLDFSAILEGMALIEQHKTIGVVTPRILDSNGNLYFSCRNEPTAASVLVDAIWGNRVPRCLAKRSETVRDPNLYEQLHSTAWATGAFLLVNRKCASDVPEWDESFFLYSEETDFMHRVRDKGWQIMYSPDVVVHHTQGGSGASAKLVALLELNKLLYLDKHGSRRTRCAARAASVLRSLTRSWKPDGLYILRDVVLTGRRSKIIKSLMNDR